MMRTPSATSVPRFFPGGSRLAALLVAVTLLVTACTDDATGPEGDVQVSVLELLDRSSGSQVAETHGTGSGAHWHGAVHLHPGETVALNARFVDETGAAVPLGGEYTVDARLASGSSTGVVTLSPHGDHVDIVAVGEGEVQVIFSLRRGSTTVWEAPPLSVEVEEHGHGGPSPSDVTSIRLDYRDGSGHIAHTHGSGAGMHWHGSMHLHPGDTVEVDVTFRNAAGDTLRFFNGGEYTLGAALAAGSPAGVLQLSVHGDHLEIVALAEGEVSLVLSIVHGDHSDFDSPAITVEVVDHHSEPHPGAVASIRLVDLDSGTELARTHGTGEDMHWHGHLHLHPGDEIEVGFRFLDADGEEIALISGDRELAWALADGSPAGVVSVAAHGDHADIEALAAGEVEILFSVMDGATVVLALPALEVEVVVH